jgi:dTDP-4-amino-4,6-dideoxygalactose transaminase
MLKNNKLIRFNEPYITGNEQKYILDVFERMSFYGVGYYTNKCQKLIEDQINAKNVILTDSCTSALEMTALLLRDWDQDQEVILPSYSFTSTAAAFARAGFKIVFAEINPKTMMIDFDDFLNKVTNKTVAVVVVHYGGFGVNTSLFKEICIKKSLYLIEDAAQAYGSIENGTSLGTIGDFGCFSFHETKNLHAGLSGALVVNNDEFKERAVCILERGANRQQVLKGLADKYSWVEIGGSFYPTEIQAAFLFSQLETFNENMKIRRKIFNGYYDIFIKEALENFYFPILKKDFQTNFHAFWVIFDSISECDFVRESLVENKINAYIGYVPLHSSKVGKRMGYSEEDLKITEEYAEKILRLPLHCNMTEDDSKMVAKIIIQFVKEYRNQPRLKK